MTHDPDSMLLNEALVNVYEGQADRPAISPAWLATETMIAIEFPRSLHALGYLGCHMQLRQMARRLCRAKFEPDDSQGELFAGLQRRYPCAAEADADPEYVLRDLMTDEDVAYNVARLRKEADAKRDHADALEAWGQDRSRVAA